MYPLGYNYVIYFIRLGSIMTSKDIRNIHNKILANPVVASEYLNEALKTGDQTVIIMALRNIVEAQEGGFSAVAKRAHLGRESMYKSLTENGNPKLSTIFSLFNSVGLELRVQPISHSEVNH